MTNNPDRRQEDFRAARNGMVETQLVARGIVDPRVLGAMRDVPRERFVALDQEAQAYADRPLPIGHGQTISQPYIVALMVQLAELGPGDSVLEVGCGSGYAAAILSRIAARVFTVERHAALAEAARKRLGGLGCGNVEVITADGTLSLPGVAPFHAILSAAASPQVPLPWKEQLAIGGRLVMPVGEDGEVQELVRLKCLAETKFDRQGFGDVRFVPLIGARGGAVGA